MICNYFYEQKNEECPGKQTQKKKKEMIFCAAAVYCVQKGHR